MADNSEPKIRTWDGWGPPKCPNCYKDLDKKWWEAGHQTCGDASCVAYYEETLRGGLDWDGCRFLKPKTETSMKEVEIVKETMPDGSVILRKKSSEAVAVEEKPTVPPATEPEKKASPEVSIGGHTSPTSPLPVQFPGVREVFRPFIDLEKRQLFIHPQAMWDMRFIAKACPFEVSGMGLVDKGPDGLFISKICLLKQEGGTAHTELDPEAQGALNYELDQQGIDTGKLRFWWHTHPGGNGVPSPSGKDLETFAKFGRGPDGIAPDWFLFAILNPNGEIYWRMDLYRPVRLAFTVEPTMWHPSFGSMDWEKEMKEKISGGYGQYSGMCGGPSVGFSKHVGWEGVMGDD